MQVIRIFILSLLCSPLFSQAGASMMMVTAESGDTYLLDDYPAAAAYSLRLLKANQIDSAAIRVRRSSDNSEIDIGFTSQGYLDTSTLKTFIGVNSGYVVTWYDQSGNENDATQGTAVNQPRIVNAGTVDRLGGEPTVVFDGSNDLLSGTYISNSTHSVFSTVDVTGLDAKTYLSNDNGSVGDFYLRKNRYFARFFTSDSDVDAVTNATSGGQSILTNIWDGELPLTPFILPPTGTLSGFQNGTLTDDSASDDNFNIQTIGLYIGWDNALSSTRFNQSIQEIIIYTSDESANRTAIEGNINTHYTIY